MPWCSSLWSIRCTKHESGPRVTPRDAVPGCGNRRAAAAIGGIANKVQFSFIQRLFCQRSEQDFTSRLVSQQAAPCSAVNWSRCCRELQQHINQSLPTAQSCTLDCPAGLLCRRTSLNGDGHSGNAIFACDLQRLGLGIRTSISPKLPALHQL